MNINKTKNNNKWVLTYSFDSIALYHCVKVRQFSDTSLENNNPSDTCGAPVLRRAHAILDHSERFPLTGLVNLSAILPITWEGPSGCSIVVACCSSLSHTWAVTLPEVAPSLLKKAPHHLSGVWTTLHPWWKQVGNWHGSSVAWPHITCVLKTSHSRGILIFAVGLLPISQVHSLSPLKRHSDNCCGTIHPSAANFRPTRRPTQGVT